MESVDAFLAAIFFAVLLNALLLMGLRARVPKDAPLYHELFVLGSTPQYRQIYSLRWALVLPWAPAPNFDEARPFTKALYHLVRFSAWCTFLLLTIFIGSGLTNGITG